mgnify:CR=1 FL=1
MSEIKTTTLSNGLRVMTDRVPHVDSVAAGVWANVGTRNENLEHNGVAHLVEHMLFKGTPTRTPAQIAEVIENVGGNMNAYTSREVTSYHVHGLKEDLGLSMEVLGDILQNSTLSAEELERERQVILQEIGMTEDTPDDIVFDNYYETAYPKQSIGAPILGKADIIKSIQRETLVDYVQRFYTPSRLVVAAAGNVEHDAYVEMVEKLFTRLPQDVPENIAAPRYEGGDHRVEKELEQSHIVLGFQGIPRLDDDYYAVQTMATILGGGMSSRLFQEVREKRGLVYSIFSFHSAYMDDGQFAIYTGTSPKDLAELIPVVCDEIGKIMHDITDVELNRAKTQLRVELLMGRESMMTRANQMAKHMLFYQRPPNVDEMLDRISHVDKASVLRVAKRIFSGKPTIAGLGPVKKLESYEKIAKRLAA